MEIESIGAKLNSSLGQVRNCLDSLPSKTTVDPEGALVLLSSKPYRDRYEFRVDICNVHTAELSSAHSISISLHRTPNEYEKGKYLRLIFHGQTMEEFTEVEYIDQVRTEEGFIPDIHSSTFNRISFYLKEANNNLGGDCYKKDMGGYAERRAIYVCNTFLDAVRDHLPEEEGKFNSEE